MRRINDRSKNVLNWNPIYNILEMVKQVQLYTKIEQMVIKEVSDTETETHKT